MGFWHALVLHFVTLMIDILVLLALSIWGSLVLGSDAAKDCSKDPACSAFLDPVHLNVILGYGYVGFSIVVKPFLVWLFLFCCGGLQIKEEDHYEEVEAQ